MPTRPPARAAILIAVALGLALPAAAAPADPENVFTFFHENVMGTSLELRVAAGGPGDARRAEGRALAEIDRLSAALSNHDPSSEFRRWQATAGGPVAVSAELFELLQGSDRWRDRTGGAFDPRAQAYSALWSRCAAAGRLPTPAEAAEAREKVARSGWRLDPAGRTARRLGDAPVTLDAIAKGYIVERACEAAMAVPGVVGVVVNAGGDCRAAGGLGATVGVVPPWADSESAEPLARFEVRGRSVATSGRSQRGFEIDGRWYSHVIDPRAGRPAEGVASATVVAPHGADADALATALNVLTPEEGVRLVDATPDAACLIVGADRRVVTSARWPALAAPVAGALAAAALPPSAPAHWSDEYELAVAFEINQPPPGEGRYRRPYVAVWVEDANGAPVRTLLLWVSQGGSGPFQWVPDLRRWYRSDQARKKVDKTELVLTMSRPTRPPGKYSVAWDGKNAKGEPVPPGDYTLFIDAAREHGTYQGMRQPVTVGGAPSAAELKGGVEIKSATVEYRRKGAAK